MDINHIITIILKFKFKRQQASNNIWKRLGLSLAAFVSDLSCNSFPEFKNFIPGNTTNIYDPLNLI